MNKPPRKINAAGSTTEESVPLEPLLLTRKQAAQALGLKEGTLRTWASLGRGPRYRKLHSGPRAGVRYPIAEIRAYAEDPSGYESRRNGN
jgi:hypothetical protein